MAILFCNPHIVPSLPFGDWPSTTEKEGEHTTPIYLIYSVVKSTLYYYFKEMGIMSHKFPLDKHRYLVLADFQRIQEARQAANERQR